MFWLIFSAGAVTAMAALTYRLSQGHEGMRIYALWFAGVCIVVAGVLGSKLEVHAA